VGSIGNLASSCPKDIILPSLSIASSKYSYLRACSTCTASGLSRKSKPRTSSICICFNVSTVDVRFTLLISGSVALGSY
jgi:hypothetical protein